MVNFIKMLLSNRKLRKETDLRDEFAVRLLRNSNAITRVK